MQEMYHGKHPWGKMGARPKRDWERTIWQWDRSDPKWRRKKARVLGGSTLDCRAAPRKGCEVTEESLSPSCPSEECHLPQEEVCPKFSAVLSHRPGIACGKWGLGVKGNGFQSSAAGLQVECHYHWKGQGCWAGKTTSVHPRPYNVPLDMLWRSPEVFIWRLPSSHVGNLGVILHTFISLDPHPYSSWSTVQSFQSYVGNITAAFVFSSLHSHCYICAQALVTSCLICCGSL